MILGRIIEIEKEAQDTELKDVRDGKPYYFSNSFLIYIFKTVLYPDISMTCSYFPDCEIKYVVEPGGGGHFCKPSRTGATVAVQTQQD